MPCKLCLKLAKKLNTTVENVQAKLSKREDFEHYVYQQAEKWRKIWPNNPYKLLLKEIRKGKYD